MVRKLKVRGISPLKVNISSDSIIWITESTYIQVFPECAIIINDGVNGLSVHESSFHIKDIADKLKLAIND